MRLVSLRSTAARSRRRYSPCAPAAAASLFHSAVNSSANASAGAGSIRCSARMARTCASSHSRFTPARFVHRRRCAAVQRIYPPLTMAKDPPHAPQRTLPVSRYSGARFSQNFGRPVSGSRSLAEAANRRCTACHSASSMMRSSGTWPVTSTSTGFSRRTTCPVAGSTARVRRFHTTSPIYARLRRTPSPRVGRPRRVIGPQPTPFGDGTPSSFS